MIFQTERLFLRKMEAVDFQDLAEILQDPQVMYAYGHDFTDEDVLHWLDRQKTRYLKYGFGLWALVLKETGEIIGQAGLTMQPYLDQEVLEVGYLLKKRHWHKGYAREAARGCVEYAFRQLHAEKVYSIIKADNLPSQRVALSIGMQKEAEFTTRYYAGDMLHYLFSISASAREEKA